MFKKRFRDFYWLIFAFFIYSISGVFIKLASRYSISSVNYWTLYLGTLFVLTTYAFAWQRVLKKFDLFIAYSAKGITIIFTFLWSVLFFNEAITVQNILGSLIIIIGIVVVNKNGS